MVTFERAAVIDADFESVWNFYDGIEGLEVLTPDWIGLGIVAVHEPDGAPSESGYQPGTEIHLELQPFGLAVGPSIRWVVEIVEREVKADRAEFVDEQVGDRGPYERWRHQHRFVDLGGETLVHDRIDYRVPVAGDLPVAHPILAAMLWHRHRRTKSLLE